MQRFTNDERAQWLRHCRCNPWHCAEHDGVLQKDAERPDIDRGDHPGVLYFHHPSKASLMPGLHASKSYQSPFL